MGVMFWLVEKRAASHSQKNQRSKTRNGGIVSKVFKMGACQVLLRSAQHSTHKNKDEKRKSCL